MGSVLYELIIGLGITMLAELAGALMLIGANNVDSTRPLTRGTVTGRSHSRRVTRAQLRLLHPVRRREL